MVEHLSPPPRHAATPAVTVRPAPRAAATTALRVAAAVATVEPLERRAMLSTSSAAWLESFLGRIGTALYAADRAGSDRLLDKVDDLLGKKSKPEAKAHLKAEKDKGNDKDDEDDGGNSGRGGDDDDDEDDKDDKDDDDDGDGGGPRPGATRDRTAPRASIDPVPGVTAADRGGATKTLSVRYTDDVAVDVASVNANDVTVVHQSNRRAATLAVTDVRVTPAADAASVVATYTLAAPGGSWDAADNGNYLVVLNWDQVADTSGNTAAATSAAFAVNVPAASPPRATISPPQDVTTAGGAEHTFTVTYDDADGLVNVSTIGVDDILVTRDGGAATLTVTGVTFTPPADNTRVTATYRVAAPGGTWDAADNGVYTVAIRGGAVADTGGATAAAVSLAFDVMVPVAAKPPVDDKFGSGLAVNSGLLAQGAVVQPDGKVVVAGRTGSLADGTSRYVLRRFNADGTPDASFGSGGEVVSAAGGNEAAYAVALDAGGGILVAGAKGGDFLVARHKPGGALDASFGKAGRSVADVGADDDAAYAVTVADDGSIVAGGSAGGAFAFARFLSDGAPDAFFGDNGVARFALAPAGGEVIGGVAVQDDGRVVGAGASGGRVVALRLTKDGSEDASFGDNGAVTVAGLAPRTGVEPDRTVGLALQTDGRVVVANRSTGGDFAVARLRTDGRADNTFGGDGLVTADFGGDDDADAVLVQGSGEVIVFGTTGAGGGRTAVAAFDAGGAPLATFGEGGKLTVDSGTTNRGRAIHMGDLVRRAFGGAGPDGRVVVGTTDEPAPRGLSPAGSDSGLRRLNVPGSGLLGKFGATTQNGRTVNRKLTFADADGTRVTLALTGGGRGRAFYDGSQVSLVLTGTGGGSTVSIKAAGGGDGRVTLRNVQSDGGLKGFGGRTTALAGTLSVNGNLGRGTFARLGNATIAATGVGTLTVFGDASNAKVLAGADLGSDEKLGGAGTAADAFAAGSIGKVRVTGKVTGSVFAAGLAPGNGVLLDNDDEVLGGAASRIGAVSVTGGADTATRFVAGSFGAVSLPERAAPDDDARVVVM